ncbi:hypothetical protein Tco_0759347 [Tanacetum coccineum]
MTPQHHDLEIELLVDLKEIPNKLETFTSTVKSLTTQVVELKTLHLLNKVTKALNKFAQVIESASKKLRDPSVPSIGQAGSHPAEGEKNTQHVTISYPTKSSSQLEGELIKKDNGKEAMSSKDVEEEKTKSDSDDDTINLTGFMVESSKKKKLKKIDFFTKQGDHVHFTEEQIKEQKRIEESIKADIAKQEVEIRKEEWIDLLSVDVDPLDRLYDLIRKKRKHVDDIHNLFRSIKKFKSSVQYGDHLAATVLNELILEIFFKHHQGPRLDNHAMTFCSLLLAEVNKRNLNPLKQMRAIEQLRQ